MSGIQVSKQQIQVCKTQVPKKRENQVSGAQVSKKNIPSVELTFQKKKRENLVRGICYPIKLKNPIIGSHAPKSGKIP